MSVRVGAADALRIVILIVLGAFLAMPASTLSQDEVESEIYPPGEVFGDGWSLVEVSPPQSRDLEEGTLVSSQAIYLGPRGARILVARLELPETLDGYEAGLQAAREAFDARKEQTIDPRGRPEDLETREFRLESAPRVADCMAMQRVEGPDMDGTQTSVGLSLCIAEPNLAIIARASGVVGGFTIHRASDFVIEQMLDYWSEAA